MPKVYYKCQKSTEVCESIYGKDCTYSIKITGKRGNKNKADLNISTYKCPYN